MLVQQSLRSKPLPRPPFRLVLAGGAKALADFIGQASKLKEDAVVARSHLETVLAPKVDQGIARVDVGHTRF